MTLVKHIVLRGLRPTFLLLVLTCALSAPTAFGQGGGNGAEPFLGPLPGTRLTFRGQGGLRMEVWSEGFDADGGLLVAESISGFRSDDGGTARGDGHTTACSRYTLIAVGPRLLMKTPHGTVTLLDMETWTVPLRTYGTLYREGATGLCRIVSRTSARLLGRERTILDVECAPGPPSSTAAPLRFRFASGLGLLTRGGMHLDTK